MSQSSFIAGCLLATFVLYLAVNGRFQTYAAILWGNTTSPLPSGGSGSGAASGGSNPIGTALDVAKIATLFAGA